MPGNDADIEMTPQLTCLYLPPNGSRFVGPGKDEIMRGNEGSFFPTFRAVRLLPSPATMTSFTVQRLAQDAKIGDNARFH